MKTHQRCDKCGHDGCLTVFEDGNAFCHSECGFIPSDSWQAIDEGENLSFKVQGYRGISKESVEKYGILTGTSPDGTEVMRVYPYPTRIKNRRLPKDFSRNSGMDNSWLFGMDKFNAGQHKAITVVEGEDDVPSAYQMLGGNWPVVGIPGASSPKKVLQNKKCYDFLNSFDQIVFVADNDGPGHSAARAFAAAFPNKAYIVDLTTEKDANDYLTKGKASEFLYTWVRRKKYTPDNVMNSPEQFLSLFRETPDHNFVPTGITELDEKIKGIMRGFFTVFKAKTGIGKTELMRMIEYNLLKSGTRIASWHLEESKLRSLLGLVSYELQDDVTRKDVIQEKGKEKEVEKAIEELTQSENYYQFYMRDEDTPEQLIEQIKYFSEVCDVKYIFVEPIQDVVAGKSDSNKEEMLADLSVRLSKLAAELGIAIVTIAHTNDDGEIKYCRMIGQRAGIIIRLDRDKETTDDIEGNTTYLYIEKNRPLSIEGYAGALFFDRDSFTLSERTF
jgi:twinkle protein